MLEIGIGHNSGVSKKPRTKKAPTIFYQLQASSTSILEISAEERMERRKLEALQFLQHGQGRRGLSSGTLAVKPNDHHKRVDVWGKCRCHVGTADDLTTAAPDDDKANHLYINDEPALRAYGMAVYIAEGQEEAAEFEASEVLSIHDIEIESGQEDEPDDTALVAPGAYYSTASMVHQRNLNKKEERS